MRKVGRTAVAGLLALTGAAAQAGSCAYGEAMAALERGNMPRALGMLQIAVKEGNGEAQALLAKLQRERAAQQMARAAAGPEGR